MGILALEEQMIPISGDKNWKEVLSAWGRSLN